MKEEWVSCRSCRGTGVLLLADVKAMLNCPRCGAYYASFMVKPEVWRDQARLNPREHCCLECLARRLKRPLTPADFGLRLPVNQGIRIGVEMGKASVRDLYKPEPIKPAPALLRCRLGLDHKWHIMPDKGENALCTRGMRHDYEEMHVPTCRDCIHLKELRDGLTQAAPAGATPTK